MIRPYENSDEDELWELKRRFELELGSQTGDVTKASVYRDKLTTDYRSSYLDWIERCSNENRDCVHVAEREGSLVGYAFVLPESLTYIWDSAVLNEIYVDEHVRGTGIADDLMETAIETARKQDLPLNRMIFDVDSSNERALAFYERWGFSHWGELIYRTL